MGDADSPRLLIEQALHEFGRLGQSHVLTFPEGDPDAVTITDQDMRGLEPEGWLSTNIIDFYIKYLQGTLPSEAKDRYYFFNSFFMEKLFEETHGSSTDTNQSKVAYERVRKWTHKVNLFEKDCIFIPVIRSSHWSLIVISHLNSLRKPPEEHKVSPHIFHLDSVEGKHGSFESQIRSYILQAWSEHYHVANGDQLLALCQMKYEQVKVPQQANGFDCGEYMLHNVHCILHDSAINSTHWRPCFGPWTFLELFPKRTDIKHLILKFSGISHLQLTIRLKSHEILSWLKGSGERDKDVENNGHEATVGDIAVDNGQQHGVEIERAEYQFLNKIDPDNQLHGANINHAKGEGTDPESAFNSHHKQGIHSKHSDQTSLKNLHSHGIVTEDATYQTTGEIPSDSQGDELQLPSTTPSKPLLGRNWSKEETLVLLNCIAIGGCFYKRNGAVICWNMISQEIQKQVGTNRTHDQCRYRYDTLLKAYKAIKDYCTANSKAFSEVVGEERRKLKLATVLGEEWYMTIEGIEIRRRSLHKASDQLDGPLPLSPQVSSPTSISTQDSEQEDDSMATHVGEEQLGNKRKDVASPKYRGMPMQEREIGEWIKRMRFSLDSCNVDDSKFWVNRALRSSPSINRWFLSSGPSPVVMASSNSHSNQHPRFLYSTALFRSLPVIELEELSELGWAY